MANTTSSLLTKEEQRAPYSPPVLDDTERTEYFTFNDSEIKMLKSFDCIEHSLYFAISLVFFKLKYTLVNFRYREVTHERQHVMQRYFPNKQTPRSFPDNADIIKRIENKVLSAVGFSRFRGQVSDKIISTIRSQAASYPRQRQLCKTIIQLMIKENGVPSASVHESIIRIC